MAAEFQARSFSDISVTRDGLNEDPGHGFPALDIRDEPPDETGVKTDGHSEHHSRVNPGWNMTLPGIATGASLPGG